jgi:hypothetical protein
LHWPVASQLWVEPPQVSGSVAFATVPQVPLALSQERQLPVQAALQQ